MRCPVVDVIIILSAIYLALLTYRLILTPTRSDILQLRKEVNDLAGLVLEAWKSSNEADQKQIEYNQVCIDHDKRMYELFKSTATGVDAITRFVKPLEMKALHKAAAKLEKK